MCEGEPVEGSTWPATAPRSARILERSKQFERLDLFDRRGLVATQWRHSERRAGCCDTR